MKDKWRLESGECALDCQGTSAPARSVRGDVDQIVGQFRDFLLAALQDEGDELSVIELE